MNSDKAISNKQEEKNQYSRSSFRIIMISFSMLLLIMFIVSIGVGRLDIAPFDVVKVLLLSLQDGSEV